MGIVFESFFEKYNCLNHRKIYQLYFVFVIFLFTNKGILRIKKRLEEANFD